MSQDFHGQTVSFSDRPTDRHSVNYIKKLRCLTLDKTSWIATIEIKLNMLPCVQEVVTPIYIVTHYINWGNYFLDNQYITVCRRRLKLNLHLVNYYVQEVVTHFIW